MEEGMMLKEKIARVIEIKRMLDNCKPLYEELDRLTVEISRESVPGLFHFVAGYHVAVVDNFLDKNTVFRPAAVKRFDLQIFNEDEFTKEEEKKRKREEKNAKKSKTLAVDSI